VQRYCEAQLGYQIQQHSTVRIRLSRHSTTHQIGESLNRPIWDAVRQVRQQVNHEISVAVGLWSGCEYFTIFFLTFLQC